MGDGEGVDAVLARLFIAYPGVGGGGCGGGGHATSAATLAALPRERLLPSSSWLTQATLRLVLGEESALEVSVVPKVSSTRCGEDAQLAVQQERADEDAAARAAAGEETRAELEGRIVEITRAYDGCVVDLTRARDGKVQIKVHAERVQATMAELERRLRDAEEGLDEAAALKDEKVSFILF
jgi:hypothetical protein